MIDFSQNCAAKITKKTLRNFGEFTIKVKDTGRGITEEELETKLADEAKDFIPDMEDTIRGEMRQTSTLAAVFASKGIDLSSLFAEEEAPQS